MPRRCLVRRRDPKQTCEGMYSNSAGSSHNHGSAVMIPSRNRTQQATQFRTTVEFLLPPRQAGALSGGPLAPAHTGEYGFLYHRR